MVLCGLCMVDQPWSMIQIVLAQVSPVAALIRCTGTPSCSAASAAEAKGHCNVNVTLG